MTRDWSRVVVKDTVGAPEAAFAEPVAPIAPEPFVPEGSTPEKLMTVSDENTLAERLAVTVTPESAADENALQTSVVPGLAFVRATNCHASPAPLTEFTVTAPVEGPVETKASRSSLGEVVEKAGTVMLVAAALPFWVTVASVIIPVALATNDNGKLAELDPIVAAMWAVAEAAMVVVFT
jgi:hypothetical protein